MTHTSPASQETSRKTGPLQTASLSIINLNSDLAQRGELPRRFAAPMLKVPLGVLLAVIAVVALILGLPLGAIANVTSVIFLLAYLAVFSAHWRLRKTAGGWRGPILLGAVMLVAVLIGATINLGRQQPVSLALLALILACCAIGQWLNLRRRRKSGHS